MSKITFRADEELVDRVERLDASKSEVMREALRAYLDEREPARDADRERGRREATLDELVAERVDALLADRLDALLGARSGPAPAGDLNLTISLEGAEGATVRREPARERAGGRDPRQEPSDAAEASAVEDDAERSASSDAGAIERSCGQCGTGLSPGHVYCPNCGEKASRRVFCECGDEIRSDWSFCPGCGRRTPAADVLDGG